MELRAANRRHLFLQDPEVRKFVDDEHKQRISDFVEEQRKQYDPKRKFDDLKKTEINRQIAEGKTLPPEEIERHQNPEVSDESNIAEIEHQTASIEKDLGLHEEQELQQNKEGEKNRREPMNFDMSAGSNVKGVAATTMGAIKQGWRTATTRHWKVLPKIGEKIEFYDNRGVKQLVEVTGVRKVGDVLDAYLKEGVSFEKASQAAMADLSVPEGWTQKTMMDHFLDGKTVNRESCPATGLRREYHAQRCRGSYRDCP